MTLSGIFNQLFKKSKLPEVDLVFVGATTQALADHAKKFKPEARLCDQQVFAMLSAGQSPGHIFYTGLGDVDPEQLYQLLCWAKTIVYVPPPSWEVHESKLLTTELVRHFQHKVVWGKEHIDSAVPLYLTQLHRLEDTRSGTGPNLFVAGSSTAHGTPFVTADEKFGSIVGKELQLPLVSLTHHGSSLSWAADQILRSDIMAGDVVVWDAMGHQRLTHLGTDTKSGICRLSPVFYHPAANPKKYAGLLGTDLYNIVAKFTTMADQHLLFDACQKIMQVNNFCNVVGAKLIIILTPHTSPENMLQITQCFEHYTNIISLAEFANSTHDQQPLWPDFGSDGFHAGPKTHKLFADLVLAQLKNE